MRKKTVVSTAAVAASLSLIAGVTAHQAGAFTAKELKACWKAPTNTAYGPLVVTVSGPQTGQRTLANGTCKAWDVPKGVYTLTINGSALRVLFSSGENGRERVCGHKKYTDFAVVAHVVRKGVEQTISLKDDSGSFPVPVEKNRLTKANLRLQCTV